MLIVFPAIAPAGPYSGGSGTQAEPYRISAVPDWQELVATPADWASHFVLTADIDLNGVSITPVAPDTSTSYGFDGTPFTGVFDGNDHIILNADVNMPSSDYVGLFGYLGTTAEIKNLGVEDMSIVGRVYVGGLVGSNWATNIANCYSTGSVTATGSQVGGLVGENNGNVTACRASASVSGRDNVGGIVGNNYSGIISHCYSLGSVIGSAYAVGGLVGCNCGIISNSYSTGSVNGSDNVGGLAGSSVSGGGAISNCYSTGSVKGFRDRVGGLVGGNFGTITNCYSTGSASGTGEHVGGLVGDGAGTVSRGFWDVNTSGWTTSGGGTGKTTSQMQDMNTFLEGGWDFLGETANGTCNFWLMPQSGGYPVLSTFNGYAPAEPSGSGTEAQPYIIRDANELGAVWYRPSASYVMANDIDLVGINWSAPFVPFFSGVFDGNEHTLSNVDVNVPAGDYVGIFGYLRMNGQLKNLGVEDIFILGRDYVGGLVGYNYKGIITNCYSAGSVWASYYVGGLVGWNWGGTITNCYWIGSVRGDWYVGGLVGRNYTYGTLNNCYSTGYVSGGDNVGGLVGHNGDYGSIEDCLSTGSVSGQFRVGGLVGHNDWYGSIKDCLSTGPVSGDYAVGGLVGMNGAYMSGHLCPGWIHNCYSTGKVSGAYDVGGLVGVHYAGEVAASFWDIESSQESTSAGGTPKTAAEMKTQSTFTSAAWDFIGETENGTEDIWAICEGTNYPRLVWQIPPGDIACPHGVNSFDFTIVARYWHETDCAALDDCDGADIDLSGAVDFGDVAAVAESWLSGL
jgi:hypothetical protein